MDERTVTKSGAPLKTTIHAALRNGICSICDVRMEVKLLELPFGVFGKEVLKKVNRAVCPSCGGLGEDVGQLIVKPTSVQAPDAPACLSPKCLWKFIMDSLFVSYLSSYHQIRVAYAVKNRPEGNKKILEQYRTGEPSPQTLWQAIFAIIKLKYRLRR